MGSTTDLPLATKAIRSRADLEDYVYNFNANNKAEYAAYYSKDTMVDQIHSCMRETLVLKKVVFSQEAVATEIHTQFRGINGFETDNLDGRWGPVWPDNGPLVRMFVWYTLDKDGHIIELAEDASVMKEASRHTIRTRGDLDHYLRSFNTNDFDTFPRYYTPDVTVILDGKETLTGKDEVVKFFRNAREKIHEEHWTTADRDQKDILHFGSGVRKGGGYRVQFLIYYELTPEGKIHHITAASCGQAKIFNPK
ncbi:uncharacterized protein NECHADRAFT_89280 [Fusarium vanettenii 77-13-4]|uniref:SnoaL-like domain-containing protein n=1 Tax=Fusarium vanettenii (strain ATCC MYA-4622 / CBS 123669 / FGSC 9596 / NRRL 45880 / 77-13-4) TaxID=660122 RepID=C7ZQQ8_FUSV7|nr:uncharacterized protein NECHADRAFT_89280 [Fusarium vanettenii 77-13-4]EEU33651.1 predicted protein [Fusarium vanettenii 77-13-4]